MKKCPFCAEEIQDDARKCRYCGEWLETQTKQSNIELPQTAPCPICNELHSISRNSRTEPVNRHCSGCGSTLLWDIFKMRFDAFPARPTGHCPKCNTVNDMAKFTCTSCKSPISWNDTDKRFRTEAERKDFIRQENRQFFGKFFFYGTIIVIFFAAVFKWSANASDPSKMRDMSQPTTIRFGSPTPIPTTSPEQIAAIAAEEGKRNRADSKVSTFDKKMRLLPNYGEYYSDARLKTDDESYRTVEIAVPNSWHIKSSQERLQIAQNWQAIWAGIRTPSDGDGAAVWIVDSNGNRVGGSTPGTGSLVSVQ